MTRRQFFARSVALPAALLGETPTAIRLTLDPAKPLLTIPENFIGLGYEISSVARPGLLSAGNKRYVELVKRLGSTGIIRIGGNTSDYSKFSPTGAAVAESKSTVINTGNLRELGTFLDATGWDLIWGLNLGRSTEGEAVEEAEAVANIAKNHLYAFEIGNEPDLFGNRATHRPNGYSYNDFLLDYRRFKTAIRSKLPAAAFAGPDVAGATDWVQQFAVDEGSDLKLLTHHYYRECANPSSTLDKLLTTDPKLASKLDQLKAASAAAHRPYRICETNSFCGGGKPGVSDTFGSALWVLDFMFRLAAAGAGGVNVETGLNQLDFVSHYSPIRDDEHGNYSAAPEYFGMLAFVQASKGRLISADYDSRSVNLTAYAVENNPRQVTVTLINKDASRDAEVAISIPHAIRYASVLRLSAPSLESKEGVGLSARQSIKMQKGDCLVHVPAGSAAIVTVER
jgi:hypothetical protein